MDGKKLSPEKAVSNGESLEIIVCCSDVKNYVCYYLFTRINDRLMVG